MNKTTCKLTIHDAYCSDGTTRAATIEVEGPSGGFSWMGGEPAVRGIVDFLGHLCLVDPRVAARLTITEGEGG